MNAKRLRELADRIDGLGPREPAARPGDGAGTRQPEAGDEAQNFDMRYWEFNCGAPACIAGWARHLWGEEVGIYERFRARRPRRHYNAPAPRAAAAALGIRDVETAMRLFEPQGYPASFHAEPGMANYVSSGHAAAVLRHLADTGEVDWSVGAPAHQGVTFTTEAS